MAKIDSGKTQIELNPQDRRIIRDLTKAIDRLTRNIRPYEVKSPIPDEKEWPTYQQYKRLTEPAKDPAEEIEEDLEPGEAQLRRPQEVIDRLSG